MSMADDIRREKARNLRYKRPMLQNINLDGIQQWLYAAQETCNEWAWVDDNQRDALRITPAHAGKSFFDFVGNYEV